MLHAVMLYNDVMIGYLKGIIIERTENNITLLTNNIGFNINILTNLEASENEEISLYIRTIVKEDDISLYGFKEKDERNLFDKLLLVNGVGPKAAMNILSGMEPDILINAIINKDVEKMTKIKGIGKKGAEKIIFSLKDKFDKEKATTVSKGLDSKSNELIQSLVFLGYDSKLANKVTEEIYDSSKNINELIKIALKKIKSL